MADIPIYEVIMISKTAVVKYLKHYNNITNHVTTFGTANLVKYNFRVRWSGGGIGCELMRSTIVTILHNDWH